MAAPIATLGEAAASPYLRLQFVEWERHVNSGFAIAGTACPAQIKYAGFSGSAQN
jgi:hypothetical protein